MDAARAFHQEKVFPWDMFWPEKPKAVCHSKKREEGVSIACDVASAPF